MLTNKEQIDTFEPLEDAESGVTAEEYHEYEDMDLAYLDSYYGDDDWARRYESTGSIDYDPDWI